MVCYHKPYVMARVASSGGVLRRSYLPFKMCATLFFAAMLYHTAQSMVLHQVREVTHDICHNVHGDQIHGGVKQFDIASRIQTNNM